jgi:enoyl-CoA hydratase/carnithine racemase
VAVLTQRQDDVAIVRLDWPERRNALGPDEAGQLADAIGAASEPEVRALVLTGSGAFCAGGDLSQLASLVQQGEQAIRDAVYGKFQSVVKALQDAPVPTIAAIDGPAVGLGMDLALACDMRFVGTSGWLRQGWAAIGLIPGTGGALLLDSIAPNLLWRLIAEQPRLNAAECVRLGLAEPCPDGSAVSTAIERARQLGALSRPAISAYLRLCRGSRAARLDVHLGECLDEQVGLLQAADFPDRIARQLDRSRQ